MEPLQCSCRVAILRCARFHNAVKLRKETHRRLQFAVHQLEFLFCFSGLSRLLLEFACERICHLILQFQRGRHMCALVWRRACGWNSRPSNLQFLHSRLKRERRQSVVTCPPRVAPGKTYGPSSAGRWVASQACSGARTCGQMTKRANLLPFSFVLPSGFTTYWSPHTSIYDRIASA